MATTFTSATFSNTYKDDYLDSDNFHRILFNSGRTLQARELTQLQTILQKQIERFGNNIFKEGAVVKPGGVNINNSYEYIKLNTSTNSLPNTPSNLVGTSFTGQTSGVVAKVIEVVAATATDPATLYVQYTSTTSSPAATTAPIRMQAGENIDNGSTTLTVQTVNTVTNPAVGTGSRLSIASGIYYTQGFFVFNENQSKIISKYSDAPNVDVGFKVVEDIVTTADDTGLYDNQGQTPNLSAPGADRYRIRLIIATREDIDSDENFVHVATIKDGVVYSTNETTDAYKVPNDVIAQRIFENSGNYIVKPFKVKFGEDSDATKLQLQVTDGIAVVEGYRAARYFPTVLRIDRATNTIKLENEVTPASFGNYVMVDPANTKGLPNINVFEKMNLNDSADYAGSVIGSARVKAVAEDGANYRYHLFDIQMNSGQAFRNVKSIGTGVTSYFNPTLENNKAVLKEPKNNVALFAIPKDRPQSIEQISLAVQRRFTTTTDGTGAGTLPSLTGGETYTNVGDWIFANADSAIHSGVSVTGAGTAAASFTGGPASSSNLEVLAYVNKSAGVVRQKTLANNTITGSIESDGNGVQYIDLGKADIYRYTQAVDASDSDISYTNRFTLDNGQRDNFYATGRLILQKGTTAPAGDVEVKYSYFQHGTSGDFFAVNSYSGQVAYADIPSHRLTSGVNVPLREVLDFRSVKDTDSEFASSANGARIHEIPQPNDLIEYDATYYVPSAGKLVINTEGNLIYEKGIDGFVPELPIKPNQSLELYNVGLGGNTLHDSDVVIQRLEYKRFTMADIGELERRVDKLEELTSLSMLEIDTKNFEVLDSSGNNRTKSGFFVDNFSTQMLSATGLEDYNASIDPQKQQLRPAFSEDNIKLIYDSDASTNTIKKGDNVYLKYTEQTYVNQPLASEAIQINPFSVVVHEGTIQLSPSSDEWRDVDRRADRVISGGVRLDTKQAFMWNNWQWNWGGTPIEQLQVGSTTNAKKSSNSSQTITNVNKVVSEESVKELVSDRVIEVAMIPFMRSRKIFFKVQGMRPNSKVFAFFDGVPVADWVRSESFAYYSDDTTDYGNLYKNATEHPDGSTTLQTDANGELSGTFFIPNTGVTRFRTGIREFKILDISVNKERDALSLARAPYAATGYLDIYQAEYLSTRVLTVQGVKSVQNKRNYRDNDGGGGSTGKPNYYVGNGVWSRDPDKIRDTYGDERKGESGYDVLEEKDKKHNDGGGGGGGGGGTVICTALYNMGELPYDVWYWDGLYGRTMVPTETYTGYYVWAKHVAKAMEKRGLVYYVGKATATAWANEMAARMTDGKVGKYNMTGKLLNVVGAPICNMIGKIIKGVEHGNFTRV